MSWNRLTTFSVFAPSSRLSHCVKSSVTLTMTDDKSNTLIVLIQKILRNNLVDKDRPQFVPNQQKQKQNNYSFSEKQKTLATQGFQR